MARKNSKTVEQMNTAELSAYLETITADSLTEDCDEIWSAARIWAKVNCEAPAGYVYNGHCNLIAWANRILELCDGEARIDWSGVLDCVIDDMNCMGWDN